MRSAFELSAAHRCRLRCGIVEWSLEPEGTCARCAHPAPDHCSLQTWWQAQ
jgi:hypothetical protein